MGVLIALEGRDGSGKTSVLPFVKAALEHQGLVVTTDKYPSSDNPNGARIRELMQNGGEYLSPFGWCDLFAQERALRNPDLLQALHESDVVILDRYVASCAIQVARLDNSQWLGSLETLEGIEVDVNGIEVPDLTVRIKREVEQAEPPADILDLVADPKDVDLVYALMMSYEFFSAQWSTVNNAGTLGELAEKILKKIERVMKRKQRI